MSWLARSIANSLKLDHQDLNPINPSSDQSPTIPSSGDSPPSTPTGGGGVKEDISELTKTLSRQFWGVASFLAPPPPDKSPSPPPEQISAADEDLIAGIRSDFAEIGGRFRTEISRLSSNKAVSGFTKIASNLLQFGDGDESEARSSVGVSEEVVAFARNVALHPETWLDFPLPDYDEDEDSDEFELSDAQQEHALAVEHLAPTLGALRIELCPGHMSESHFWKIYFVLLHPRLNKYDALLLSTPEIVKARAMLTHELQNRGKAKAVTEYSGITDSPREGEQLLSVPLSAQADLVPVEALKSVSEPSIKAVDFGTDKHPVQSAEVKVVDKAVIKEGPVNPSKYQEPVYGSSSKVFDEKFEDDGDEWLKEEDSSEIVGVSGTSIPIENDEDVSFSDLEEDDDGDVPISFKKTSSGSDVSSTKDSRDWVQLSQSSTGSEKEIASVATRPSGSGQVRASNAETKETSDWLDVDDIDDM